MCICTAGIPERKSNVLRFCKETCDTRDQRRLATQHLMSLCCSVLLGYWWRLSWSRQPFGRNSWL